MINKMSAVEIERNLDSLNNNLAVINRLLRIALDAESDADDWRNQVRELEMNEMDECEDCCEYCDTIQELMDEIDELKKEIKDQS